MGLLAVAIPVIIHLVNLRRPEKISFSTLSFLNELKKSTIKRIRFKQYLLMSLRALAILFLALALARPFLPPTLNSSAGSDAPTAIALLIDNSPSMNRIGTEGPLIDQAKEIAGTIINTSRTEDRFVVSTTNGALNPSSLTQRERALELIEEIEPSNTGNYITRSLNLLYDQLQQSPQQQSIVYIITDGQKSQLEQLESFQTGKLSGTRSVALQMVKLEDINQQNLTISDIELKSQMLSRETPVRMQVEVQNVGDAVAANQFVSLEVEDRMAGQYQATLKPGQSQEFLFEFNAKGGGDINGQVILEGDDVIFDNTRYFVLRIPDSRSVLLIHEEEDNRTEFVSYLDPALEAARQSNTQINFTKKDVADTDQANWDDYDVLVFDGLKEIPEYWFEELQRFVQEGKGIIFFPSEKGTISNYNNFMELFNAGSFTNIHGEYASFRPEATVGSLAEGHPVLEELFDKKEDKEVNLDLPELYFYYDYESLANAGSYRILETERGLPILAEQRFGEGKLLISSIGTDAGWSNFPVNPLFAPLYYRTILYAASSEQGGMAEHLLGKPFEWEGRVQTQDIELTIGSYNIRPEVHTLPEGVRVTYPGRDWEPGILEIDAKDVKRQVAVNQNIMESTFNTLDYKKLEELLGGNFIVNSVIEAAELDEKQLQGMLRTASFGKEIWNWFIWIAITLLVAELMVARLYKAETIS